MFQEGWRQIVIDEYVPVVRGEGGLTEGVPWGGGHGRGLWCLLLEKALAKLCGGYEPLHRSEPGPLLMALTGEQSATTCWVKDGNWWSRWRYLPPERSAMVPISLDAKPTIFRRVRGSFPRRCKSDRVYGTWHQALEFFDALRKSHHQENALLLAYAHPGHDVAGERRSSRMDPGGTGLVLGHGYSVLQLINVEEAGLEDVRFHLVQLRNIWGPEAQWRGPWADGSVEWERWPEVRRHYLRQDHAGTGRFWMSFQDLFAVFDRIETCPMPQAARKASYVPKPIAQRGSSRSGGGRRTRGLQASGRRRSAGFFS
mmetsp:Transcript_102017/g.175938  ORF Transcript_102017/g.175938 Transcript_102017/m.175938 type:complete len:313 (+) Transcript_102017:3-941(+)